MKKTAIFLLYYSILAISNVNAITDYSWDTQTSIDSDYTEDQGSRNYNRGFQYQGPQGQTYGSGTSYQTNLRNRNNMNYDELNQERTGRTTIHIPSRQDRGNRDTFSNIGPRQWTSYNDTTNTSSDTWSRQDSTYTNQENPAKLQEKIHDALKGGFFTSAFNNVNARLENGDVAILTGTVETEKDRKEAEIKVLEINGVRDVINRIQVLPKRESNRTGSNY